MSVSRRRIFTVVWAAIGLTLAAHAACADAPQKLTVFAAASLKNALDEAGRQYEQRSGNKVINSYAASSALARQIENGAPADLFISADTDWMDHVEKRNLLKPGTRINLLRNEIVLIAPAASAVAVEIKRNFPLARLLGDNRLAMADPDSVPAGKYGKAALQALGVWPSVANKVARAENVTAALLFVSRAEAPLGIVYRTDAVSDKRVRIVGAFPAGTHPPVVYPAALLGSGKSPNAAKFFKYLKSGSAMEIFRKHGFMPY